jgi:hypothetical protein
MSCQPTIPFIELPPTFSTCTWPGLTWRIDSTDSTEFDAVLSSAAFQLQTESGTAALTLSSATAGQVTLNNTAARAWDITVDPRILSLAAGNYAWALETTDADGVVKPILIGSLQINPDPIL